MGVRLQKLQDEGEEGAFILSLRAPAPQGLFLANVYQAACLVSPSKVEGGDFVLHTIFAAPSKSEHIDIPSASLAEGWAGGLSIFKFFQSAHFPAWSSLSVLLAAGTSTVLRDAPDTPPLQFLPSPSAMPPPSSPGRAGRRLGVGRPGLWVTWTRPFSPFENGHLENSSWS